MESHLSDWTDTKKKEVQKIVVWVTDKKISKNDRNIHFLKMRRGLPWRMGAVIFNK